MEKDGVCLSLYKAGNISNQKLPHAKHSRYVYCRKTCGSSIYCSLKPGACSTSEVLKQTWECKDFFFLFFLFFVAEQILTLALCCTIIIYRVAAKLNTSVYQMKVK